MSRSVRETSSSSPGSMGRRAWLLALPALLVACVEITATPESASTYQGEWSGPGVTLSIRARRIVYRRTGGAFGATLVEDEFRGLSGNDVIYGKKNNRIRVDVPPHRDGAFWKMTVEGVEVQRPDVGGGGTIR